MNLRQAFTLAAVTGATFAWGDSCAEPTSFDTGSYRAMANLKRQYALEFRIVEARHAKDLTGAIGIWVSQLNYLRRDYEHYRDRQVGRRLVSKHVLDYDRCDGNIKIFRRPDASCLCYLASSKKQMAGLFRRRELKS